MSVTLTMTGNKSVLETSYVPPPSLDGKYQCGLLYFLAVKSIPTINGHNNCFVYGEYLKEINIPTGIYNLQDIYEYLEERVSECELYINPNNNTMKCSLFCTKNNTF